MTPDEKSRQLERRLETIEVALLTMLERTNHETAEKFRQRLREHDAPYAIELYDKTFNALPL